MEQQQEKPQWSLGAILANAEREAESKKEVHLDSEYPNDSVQFFLAKAAKSITLLDGKLSTVPMEEVTELCKSYGFDLKLQDAVEALEVYGPVFPTLESTDEFTPNEKVFRLKMENSELGSANFRIIPSVIQVIVHLPEGKFAGFKPESDEFGFNHPGVFDDRRLGYIAGNKFMFDSLLMVKLDSVAKSVEDLTMKMALEFRDKFLTPPPHFPASAKKKVFPKRKIDDDDDDL